MDGLEKAALQLARQAAVPLPFKPVFTPLVDPASTPLIDPASKPLAGPASLRSPRNASARVDTVVAVDGSHAVLWDNGAIWVVAYRAADVVHGAGPAPPVEPVVVAVAAGEAQAAVDLAWAQSPHIPRVAKAEALAEALRAAAELAAIERACEQHPGALVLIDGALHGLPPHAAWASARMLDAARRHGCRMVGVAKRSGLASEGAPLLPAIARLAPAGCWAAPLPGTPGAYAARLHPASSHVFRIDAAGIEDVEALLPLCRDVAYPGYPYPLAKAHNTVAITGSDSAALRARLEAAVRRHGPEAWQVLADFHQVLDRGVPG